MTQVGSSTLSFDANGNMTTDEVGRRFRYDAWNRIVGATDSEDNPIIDFTYDALNRRIQEIRPSETRDLFYSTDWQLLEEQVEEVAVVHYVWSPVYVDAMILRDGADSGDPQPVLYAMEDANFNVTGLVDTSGSVQERYVYDPYGAVTYLTGAWGSRSSSLYGWVYNHQGLRFVLDVGLIDSRARFLSPTLQRWVSADPVWATNLYVAYGNGPVSLLDPWGLWKMSHEVLGRWFNWNNLQIRDVSDGSATDAGVEVMVRPETPWSLYGAIFALPLFGSYYYQYGHLNVGSNFAGADKTKWEENYRGTLLVYISACAAGEYEAVVDFTATVERGPLNTWGGFHAGPIPIVDHAGVLALRAEDGKWVEPLLWDRTWGTGMTGPGKSFTGGEKGVVVPFTVRSGQNKVLLLGVRPTVQVTGQPWYYLALEVHARVTNVRKKE